MIAQTTARVRFHLLGDAMSRDVVREAKLALTKARARYLEALVAAERLKLTDADPEARKLVGVRVMKTRRVLKDAELGLALAQIEAMDVGVAV